jgi:hypothetical protein
LDRNAFGNGQQLVKVNGITESAVPAAVQITACRASDWSTTVRSRLGWPTGATPPITPLCATDHDLQDPDGRLHPRLGERLRDTRIAFVHNNSWSSMRSVRSQSDSVAA